MAGCTTSLEAADIPDDLPFRDELFPDPSEWINPGDAVVYKPFAGLHAVPRRDASRPDVFQLHVNRKRQVPVEYSLLFPAL